MQASNLNSDGAITINTSILNILADISYNLATSETRTKKTMAIRNNTTGNIVTDITDSSIVSNSGNYNFNITDQANITREQDAGENTGEPAYLTALKQQVNNGIITETQLQQTSIHWEDTTRQMTDVAQASVAVAAVAITAVTLGTGAGIGAIMLGAVAATAGTLAANTAIQAGMNADGDFFKQAKDISKDTWDSTTSRDAFESYVIAAAAAGITAGATQYINGVTNGAIAAGNAAGATATQQLTTAIWESAISSTTSVAVQSALAGESFSEALKSQAINLVAGAVGNFGAKQIGSNYHTGNFGDGATAKATQLTLHAILGATTATIAGNDALSGAVSGVIGEVAGELVRNSAYGENTVLTQEQKNIIKEVGGLAGAFSAIFTGSMEGLDDSEIAQNMYSGQRIGKNAVENNLLYDVDEVVGAVSDYREAREVMENAGDGEDNSSDEVVDSEYSNNEVTTDDIKTLMALNDIANGIPSANLDILPEGTAFMDGESSLIINSEGASISIEKSLVTIPDPLGIGTIGFGNVSFEVNFNTSEIGVGGSISSIKYTYEKTITDNVSGEIEINYGGVSVKASSNGEFKAKGGLDIEAHMKVSN